MTELAHSIATRVLEVNNSKSFAMSFSRLHLPGGIASVNHAYILYIVLYGNKSLLTACSDITV
jgi:hypothetical protein